MQAVVIKGTFKNKKLQKITLLILENLKTIELTRESHPKTIAKVEELAKRKKPEEDIIVSKTDKIEVNLVQSEEIKRIKENFLKPKQHSKASFLETNHIV